MYTYTNTLPSIWKKIPDISYFSNRVKYKIVTLSMYSSVLIT